MDVVSKVKSVLATLVVTEILKVPKNNSPLYLEQGMDDGGVRRKFNLVQHQAKE
jgi:hypothetical protein